MGFFDQYKSIKRSTITVDSKQATRDALVQSLNNPTTKSDAIQVVKKLLEFKVEQSRSDTAERLLGGLTTPLESLNAKRGQRTGGDPSSMHITLESLQELVRNRSAIFKRQLPDTFKGLLRDTYLRDGEARAILVNTNTAAFLKSNDLITAAEVRTATPEVGFGRQLFPQDVANMLNSLANDAVAGDRPVSGLSKTFCSSFLAEVAQANRDLRRLSEAYKNFAWPSVRRVCRSLARASAAGGLNRERLLQPQTSIAGINSLAQLKSRVMAKGAGHAWIANANRRALETGIDRVTDGIYGDTEVLGANGTSHNVTVSTGLNHVEWMHEARNTFGPDIFEFDGHVSLIDGLAVGGSVGGFRRSQRLSPDVQHVKRNRFGAYERDLMELRGARALQFDSGALDDRSLDTFDMLVLLGLNQGLCAWPNRHTAVTAERQNQLRAVEIVNATERDGVGGAREFIQANYWHHPIRISRSSREVEYVLLSQKAAMVFPGPTGASQQFVPYKTFTVRFSWCQRTNFVSKTIVDETPWRCSHHYEWVPPMDSY